MVTVNVISVIMMEYPISYREVCYVVNRRGIHFSALYRPNSWLLRNTSLIIYSSCLRFIHQITITTEKKLLCVIQFQFHPIIIPARTQACTSIMNFYVENDFKGYVNLEKTLPSAVSVYYNKSKTLLW